MSPRFKRTLPLAACSMWPLALLAAHEETRATMETVLVHGKQISSELVAHQALTPGGVSLIDGDELYRRGVSNLADMLRYVPGVWAASGSTGDGTFLSSRGSNLDATSYDGNGIKLMQDGLPVTAADGNNHNRQVDPLSASEVIVARGANALTYGASTLGGAIDFITPTAHNTRPQLFISGGSDELLQARVTAGSVVGAFDGLITAEIRQWDGYRDHMRQEREGFYANAGWQFSDAVSSRLYLSYIDNEQELPGALTRDEWRDDSEQANPGNLIGNYLYNVRSWRIANKTVWEIDDHSSLTVGFSYEEQALYHPIVYSPFFSLLIDTDQRTAGASLRYHRHLGDHDLVAGIDYGQTAVAGGDYSHRQGIRRALTTRIDNDAENLELFLVDRWEFAPQWTLVYGAQAVIGSREVRNVTVSNGSVRNPQGDYDSINPRVGLIHQLTPDVELFANISKLYEAPTNYELEDDVRGSAETLDAMHGMAVEIGTRGTQALGAANHWHWDVALYYAQLKDEILSKDDPAAPGTSLSTNVDDTIHAGIEALFGASFALDSSGTHRFEPQVSITINRFSFDGDPLYGDNDLPAAPGYVVKGELLYRHANGFFAGPTFDIVDERYADFSNTYTVGAYELLGLRAGLTRERWDVWAEIRNITDEAYVALFSVKDIAAPNAAILTPGEPRSAHVGIRFEF